MKKKRGIAMTAVLAVVLAFYFGKNVSMALFDQNNAVQMEDFSAIEDSTLLIGTHLIYLHSLNDQIYGIAMESASDSGQDRIYYKSELAGGMWMDITDAGSINDISAGGTAADPDTLKSLYLTHHTRSDGITYDLRTGAPVCIFDITPVYELETLPELEALKLRYDMMREQGSDVSLIEAFFRTEVRTAESGQCDAQLQALQNYYNELASNNGDSKDLQTVTEVMEKVSSARKYLVFAVIEEALDRLQDEVEAAGDGTDDTLPTAIGDSQHALGESRAEAESNMLSEQDGVISEKEYALCTEMISNAEGGNFYGCDEQNLQLQYLGNIKDGRIVNGAEELRLLEELIGRGDAGYREALSAGTTPEYELLVSQHVSHAAREKRMQEDVAGANVARGELEFLIQGAVDRREGIPDMAGSATQNYILGRIQDAADFKAAVKQDDYAGLYQDSVSEYVQWLNDLLSRVKQAGGSREEEDSLYEQKEALREQKLEALDLLDIDTAKRIDAMIAAVDEEIQALERNQSRQLEALLAKQTELKRQLEADPGNTGLLEELGRLEAELAAGESDLDRSSQAANIMESKNEILGMLAEGDVSASAMDRLGDHVELLSSMLEGGSPLAMEAMKEVYTKLLAKSELEGVNAYDSIRNDIETAISESAVRVEAADRLSSHSAGDVVADALGVDGLLAADGSIRSESLEEAAPEDVLAALLALGSLGGGSGADSSSGSGTGAESSSGGTGAGTASGSGTGTGIPSGSGAGVGISSGGTGSGTSSGGGSGSGVLSGEGAAVTYPPDPAAAALAGGLAEAAGQSPGLPVFQTREKQGESYVPVEVLAKFLDYRYVWNETRRTAVLSRGREFYSFTAYDGSVLTEKEESLSMDSAADFSGQLYIPGSFVQKQFGYSVHVIAGTDWSVLVDDKVIERSQEILSELLRVLLLEKGGY